MDLVIINKIIAFIEEKINHLELNYNKHFVNLIVGALLLFAAMLYVWPRRVMYPHGVLYAQLSENPFNFSIDNPLRFRILSPVIGYLTGLRGDYFAILPFIFGLILISLIYKHCREKNYTVTDSVFTTCLLSFSSVFFFNIAFIGFTDLVSYFFIFLCFTKINKNIFLAALFFMLAVFNHESNLFAAPPLILYATIYNTKFSFKKALLTAIAFAAPILIYYYFRQIVSQLANVEFTANFYFRKENIYKALTTFLNVPLGLFYVFKLFWFFPLLAFLKSIYQRNFKIAFLVFSFIFFPFLQLFIAWDVTRLLCLCFPVMFISVDILKPYFKGDSFSKFTLILIIANLFVPQYIIMKDGPDPLLPAFIALPYYALKDHIIQLLSIIQ